MALYHPILTDEPDFTTAPRYGINVPSERLNANASRDIATFVTLQDDLLITLTMALDSPREIFDFMEFFRERGGQAMPFYLPSWRADILLAGTAAAGAQMVPIAGTGYEAAHLTGTPEDWPGRQVWIWHPEHGLFAERVLRVVTDGEGVEHLDLDGPLPWDLTEDCFAGFCYLARFAEETLQWDFSMENVAAVDVGFRCTRAWTTVERTNDVEQVDQYASLGFVTISSFRSDNTPVDPITNRVSFTDGPFTLHEPVDGYYAKRWAAYPSSDGAGVRMRKVTAGPVWLPAAAGTLSELFDETPDTDHLTWCFDQTAFEVVAYQMDAGTVEVRHFFNGDIEIVSWAGRDPIVIWNYQLDPIMDVGDSDVVAYYIKEGQGRLFARFQRDNFGTEYVIAHLPVEPLALKRGFYEDRHYLLEFLDTGFRTVRMTSAVYPVRPPPPLDPEVTVAVAPEFMGTSLSGGASYFPAVTWADGSAFDAMHAPFSESGPVSLSAPMAYLASVVYADGRPFEEDREPLVESATATVVAAEVRYSRVVVDYRAGTDSGGVALSAGMWYQRKVITPGPTTEGPSAINLTAGISYD